MLLQPLHSGQHFLIKAHHSGQRFLINACGMQNMPFYESSCLLPISGM